MGQVDKRDSEVKPWLRRRRYVHFDKVPSPATIENVVFNPDDVARHAFFPFLGINNIVWKVSRISGKKLRRTGKMRPIRYAAHLDSAIYCYYNSILNSKYEEWLKIAGLDQAVIAFRALGKSNIDFALDAFEWIEASQPCIAFGFDVKDFFGSLDHRQLKQKWTELLEVSSLPPDHYAVYKSLTRYSFANLLDVREALGLSRTAASTLERLCSPSDFRTKIRAHGLVETNLGGNGIPQGSPLSATLSNIYMFEFDKRLHEFSLAHKAYYRRYCDDILIVVRPNDAAAAKVLIEAELAKLCLELQSMKTTECAFPFVPGSRSIQYLGLMYDGRKVYLRSSGISRYYRKMRRGIIGMGSGKAGKLKLVRRRAELLKRYTVHKFGSHQNFHSYVSRVDSKTGRRTAQQQMKNHVKKFNESVARQLSKAS